MSRNKYDQTSLAKSTLGNPDKLVSSLSLDDDADKTDTCGFKSVLPITKVLLLLCVSVPSHQ